MKRKFSLIRTLVLLFFGSLALGQFQRIQITPQIAIYLHDLLLGCIYLASLFHLRSFISFPKKYSPLIKSFLIFSFTLFISFLFSIVRGDQGVISGGLYLLRFLFYALIFPTFYLLRTKKIIVKSFYRPLTFMAGGLMASGLFQRVFFPDMRNFTLLGWDDHLYRSIGSLLDPNFLGLMLVLALILSIKISLKRKNSYIFLLIFTLLFTYSRSSFVAFIAAFVTLGIQRASKKVVVTSIGIILIGALLLPRPGGEGIRLERTASIFSRLDSQKKALEIFSSSPVIGIGFNNYKSYVSNSNQYSFVPNHPSGPDNSFLLILITSGLVGFTGFLYMSYHIFKTYRKNQLILPSIAAIATHSLFNNSLFYPWVLIWIFTLVSESLIKERS